MKLTGVAECGIMPHMKSVRISDETYQAAEAEGRASFRSIAQQVEYWIHRGRERELDSGKGSELVRLRNEKRIRDDQRMAIHVEFLRGLSGERVTLAKTLAGNVINSWQTENACGTYYIDRWRKIIAADDMLAAYLGMDRKEAMAMATNSPFLHGSSDGERVIEIVNAKH